MLLNDRRGALAYDLLGGEQALMPPQVDPETAWWQGLAGSYARQPTDPIANAAQVLSRVFSPDEWARQAQSLGNWPDPRSVMNKGILGSNEDWFNFVTNVMPFGFGTMKGINANLSPIETEMLQKA